MAIEQKFWNIGFADVTYTFNPALPEMNQVSVKVEVTRPLIFALVLGTAVVGISWAFDRVASRTLRYFFPIKIHSTE